MVEKKKVSSRYSHSIFKEIKITEWITTFATVAAVFAALWVLYQNNAIIKTANDTYQLSLVPTLNIEYPTTEKPDSIVIQNTSNTALINIETFSVCYLVSTKETREIINRYQSSSLLFPTQEKLGSKKQFEVSVTKVMDICPIPEPTDTSANRIYVLVITFHREVDNKRFVKIEPFGGGFDKGIPIAIPAYSNSRSSSGGGNPLGIIETLKKIEETEKVFFRASE